MVLRRICGLILGLLMFHLTIVGADLSCSAGVQASRAQHVHDAGHDHHAMAMAGGQDQALDEQSCQTPAQAECCRVMASCAVNVAVASISPLANVLTTDAVRPPRLVRTPRSRIAAPDPPPPRA